MEGRDSVQNPNNPGREVTKQKDWKHHLCLYIPTLFFSSFFPLPLPRTRRKETFPPTYHSLNRYRCKMSLFFSFTLPSPNHGLLPSVRPFLSKDRTSSTGDYLSHSGGGTQKGLLPRYLETRRYVNERQLF